MNDQSLQNHPGNKFHLASALWLLSPVLWMRTTTDPIGWAWVEASAAALFLRLLWTGKDIRWPAQPVAIPLLIFILIGACSAHWSPNFHSTLMSLYQASAFLLLAAVFLNDTPEWSQAFKTASIITGIAICLLVAGERFAHAPWIMHPSLLSGFLLLSAIICSKEAAEDRASRRSFYVCTLFALLLTQFLLAAFAPFVLSMIFVPLQLFRGGMKRTASAILAAAIILTAVLGWRSEAFLIKRKLTDPHALERIQIWGDSLKMIQLHPWRGVGLGAFRDVYPQVKSLPGLRNAPYAHNELLNLLCELGLLGGWVVLGLLIWILRTPPTETTMKEDSWTLVTWAALAHALVDFNLHYAPIFLLFIFSVAPKIPRRNMAFQRRGGWTAAGLTLFVLYVLPGAAGIAFARGALGSADAKAEGARLASRLDPFNGLYRSESGRMRDLEMAMLLEPLNPWYKRSAAIFLSGIYSKDHDPERLVEALALYDQILRVAPGIEQFRSERAEILRQIEGKTSKID